MAILTSFNISLTEGRLKDVHERRPKLVMNDVVNVIITNHYFSSPLFRLFFVAHLFSQSTLNSAASIKKWIPSIMNEIEYYLQVRAFMCA